MNWHQVLDAATRIGRWISVPVLLTASVFSRFTGSYAIPMDLAIWLGVLFLAQRAVRSGQYAWSAGLGVVVIAFSPLLLRDRIFLCVGYTGIVTLLTLVAAFRPEPLAAKP